MVTSLKVILILLILLLPNTSNAQIFIPPEICPPGYIVIPPDTCIPESNDQPVVLVPGILVSFNPKVTLLDETGGTWGYAPTTRNIYRGLIERLEEAGINVTVAHYDWRKSVIENSNTYLKASINEALLGKPPGTKVDIVAHSMGGLVARDYVQGNQYEDDVDQVITLGTPHKGAADSYVAWEGGQIPSRWNMGVRAYMTLVERSLNIASGAAPLLRPTSFRTFFPGLHDLLPTESFINRLGTLVPLGDMETQIRNLYLEQLNVTRVADFNAADVSMITLGGTNLDTLQTIPTGEIEDRSLLDELRDRWRDGHPNPDPPEADTTAGDQTVLLSSARLHNTTPLTGIKHEKLPEEAQEIVLEILGHDSDGTHIAYDLPEEVLTTAVLSPIMPTVTGPNGEILSANQNTFPEAEFIWDPDNPNDPKLLAISNPPTGQYTFTYTGTGSGEYHVITSYADADETITSSHEGTTAAGKTETEVINVGTSTTSLVDDTDYKAHLREVGILIKDALKERLLKGPDAAKLTAHLVIALADLKIYEYQSDHGRMTLAQARLRSYYSHLTDLKKIATTLQQKPALSQFANQLLERLEKIKHHSPPLQSP